MTFVGVCGGRRYGFGGCEKHTAEGGLDSGECGDCHSARGAQQQALKDILGRTLRDDDVVVQGGAGGADFLAANFAAASGRQYITAHANWDKFGKSAGHRRNAVIAALPLRLLIAFPGGAGTASMVKMARAKGIEVLAVTA